jgi:hypothetical protein
MVTGCSRSAIGTFSTAIVDGCTFSENTGAVEVRSLGGPCSLEVKHSSFVDTDTAGSESAIRVGRCPLVVSASSFSGNRGTSGGAIDVDAFGETDYEVTIEDSQFDRNEGWPGAAVTTWGGTVTLTRNLFQENIGGSAVYLRDTGDVTIVRSRFLDNEGGEDIAGALTLWGADARISDSEFARNHGPRSGAILLLDGSLTLVNVTVAKNVGAVDRAGLESYGPVTIRNSIFWANQPTDILAGEFELGVPPGPEITASNFTGGDVAQPYDPHFVDPESDRRLSADSPCIDQGSDADASTLDLLGHPREDIAGRPLCPPETPECGGIADMGAYEHTPP